MLGVIRKRDVVVHPLVTIQCFGWRVFWRTLVAPRNQTFLSLLMGTDILEASEKPRVEVPDIVDRCVQLELRAMSLYRRLAQVFSENARAREFFETVAKQELQHAELLELCREAAGRTAWASERFEPCAKSVPGLEEKMDGAEAALDGELTLTDALRLTVEIESSEVNRVFQGVVAASDCDFIRALKAFHLATAQHLSYIRDAVPELEAGLEEDCLVMSEKYAVPA